ncbi:MAG: YqaA family protein [Parvularculales bacterium]
MLRRLYDWTLTLGPRRGGRWALAGVAFTESSFFPIPPDILLIPMVLGARNRAWQLAIITTLASVAGGAAGYAIGYFLYEFVGQPMIDLYGYEQEFERFTDLYERYGLAIVLIAGFTPLPYKVITIASGVAALNLPMFIIASLIARGARFFAVAGLLWWLGPAVRHVLERYFNLFSVVFVILLIAGFVVIGWFI